MTAVRDSLAPQRHTKQNPLLRVASPFFLFIIAYLLWPGIVPESWAVCLHCRGLWLVRSLRRGSAAASTVTTLRVVGMTVGRLWVTGRGNGVQGFDTCLNPLLSTLQLHDCLLRVTQIDSEA